MWVTVTWSLWFITKVTHFNENSSGLPSAIPTTGGGIKFGPQKFRTKIEICHFSVGIFGPKIIGGFEIFGQKLSKIQNFDTVRYG